MPRLKNRRRAEAQRKRMAKLKLLGLFPRRATRAVPLRGTGYRHPAVRWPLSPYIHLTHKLVIPAESPDKKFILVVGDCQLRGLVAGHVQMPEGELSFGFLAITKATAADLRNHVLHAVLPRTPDVVCLLAPSVHLCNIKQFKNIREEFGSLLTSICSCWPKVFVLDFPPSVLINVSKQELIRKQYRQAAAKIGISYVPVAKHFPLDRLELWSNDGVHLSDSDGMPILAQLLWDVTCIQVEGSWPEITPPADRDKSCFAVKKRADQQEEGIVIKDCSVQCSYILHDYLHRDISQDSAPASTADPKGPRRSARLHHQSLVAPKKVEATAPVAKPSSAPAVAVKEEIATPSSDQPPEKTWEKVASNLWRWDLCEQQPISDEEELEAGPVEWGVGPVGMGAGPVEMGAGPVEVGAGPVEMGGGPVEVGARPVDDADASAAGNHMAHVINFAIDDMEVRVKIEEEDNVKVTPTMQEDFSSSDRQQLPDEVKNFQEKLSVTEANNIGLQADLQVMMYQLEQRDREIFSLRNKVSAMDKHYNAMEEKWQKQISKLRLLLRKRGKEARRADCKLQLQSRAHLNTLVQLDAVKSALDRSKMIRKSAEEQLKRKLAQKEESHQRELKEREESLRQRLARASRREQAILSESWESKAQKWHEKKAELEEMMVLKEKIWEDKEANLKESIKHLTKQNSQLQKLLNEQKRAEVPLKLLDS